MRRKEGFVLCSVILLLLPAVSAVSNIQYTVDGSNVTLTYEGTAPFFINIRGDTNIGAQGGYVQNGVRQMF